MITVEQIKDVLNGKISYYDTEIREMTREGLPQYEITYEELLKYFKMFMDNTFGSMYGAQGSLELIQQLIGVSTLYKEANPELKQILDSIRYHYGSWDFYVEEGKEIYRHLYNYKKPYEERLLTDKEHLVFVKKCIENNINDSDFNFAINTLVEHKDPEGTYLFGYIHYRDKDYEAAEKYFKLSGELGVIKGYLEAGYLYLEIYNKPTKMIVYQMFSKALALDSNNIDALIGLSMTYHDGNKKIRNEELSKELINRALDLSNDRYEALLDIDYRIALLAIKRHEYVSIPRGHFDYKEARVFIRAIDYINNENKYEENRLSRLYEILDKNPGMCKLAFQKRDDYQSYFVKGERIIFKDLNQRAFEGEIVDFNVIDDYRYDHMNTFVKVLVRNIIKDDEDHSLYKTLGEFYMGETYLTLHFPRLQILSFYKKDKVFDELKPIDGYIQITSEKELRELNKMFNGDHDLSTLTPHLEENELRYISIIVNQKKENRFIHLLLDEVIETKLDLTYQEFHYNSFKPDFIEKNIEYIGGSFDSNKVIFKKLYYRIEEKKE